MGRRIAIALASDYKYIRQLETTIKSILKHNRNVYFYLIHEDIPQEWFVNINKKLRMFNSKIINLQIILELYEYNTYCHISKATFYRYYIPQLIDEEVVLYLDSDIIITDTLEELFNINLGNNYCAAVLDEIQREGFNAGVLLFNNKLCKKDNISKKLFDFTNEKGKHHILADQYVLNEIFKNRIMYIDKTYNAQIGSNLHWQIGNKMEKLIYEKDFEKLPKIIHYTTSEKPWNYLSSSIYKRLWWEYNNLDWLDLLNYNINVNEENYIKKSRKIFILTYTDSIESITYLIDKLKKFEFHIAAFTEVSEKLILLQRYDNVRLYRNLIYPVLETLIENADVYLDINYGYTLESVLDKFHNLNKPVFSFDVTNHDSKLRSKVFKLHEVDKMIEEIKNIK